MKESKQKNIIIGSLIAVILVMAIGYAAFATQLNINGSAAITSNWCVGFDNTKTSTYTTTTGVSGATAPTGTMSYGGNTCQSVASTVATLNTTLHQPGDKVVYTLTILNKGSVDATIDSVLVDDVAKTTSYTETKGNIKFTVTMPVSNTVVATSGSTTMTVTAEFQNDTPVSSLDQAETQSITIKINAGEGGGSLTPSTQTVYAWNTTSVIIGSATINDLASTVTSQPYYNSASEVMSASGYTYYNMYTVENDTITEGYSCQTFGELSTPVCLKMSTNGSEYGYDAGGNHTGKLGILKDLDDNNASFTGSCSFSSYASGCSVGDLTLGAFSGGAVYARDYHSGAYCTVSSDGRCELQ